MAVKATAVKFGYKPKSIGQILRGDRQPKLANEIVAFFEREFAINLAKNKQTTRA